MHLLWRSNADSLLYYRPESCSKDSRPSAEHFYRWARIFLAAGADAILLIAALYQRPELLDYANRARSLGLVPLVETHSQDDVDKLGNDSWELVGVNNRDLETFEVDLHHSVEAIHKLPEVGLKVAESGISTPKELRMLSDAGFDAFLVGESLLLADDPEAKLRELLSLVGEPRRSPRRLSE